MGNSQMSGMLTYNGVRTQDTVIFFVFILYCHIGTYAKDLGLTDIIAIPLTNCWAAVALLQFCNIAVVQAGHHSPAHTNTTVTSEDVSAAGKEVGILSDAVTRLSQC